MKLLLRILALLAVVFALYVIVGEQLVGSSGEAFVNTRLATVRAPQSGTVQLTVPPLGARVRQSETLGSIITAETEDGYLQSLERGLAESTAEAGTFDSLPTEGFALERRRAAARVDALAGLVEARRTSIASMASSALRSPVNGVLWSVRATPTEYVPQAEALLSIADCSAPLIHASVDQRLFNRLQAGDAAQFRFHGGESIDVTVALLAGTGPRTLLETLAITPTARQLEGYTVLLSAPALTNSPECPIGRTGRVIFSQGPLATIGELWSRTGL
jgi:hypothetical protein